MLGFLILSPILSLCIVYLIITLIRFKNLKKKANIFISQLNEIEDRKKNPSWETQMVLADLFNGNALLRIERIDTNDVLIRRR